jgi:hypothetical protein
MKYSTPYYAAIVAILIALGLNYAAVAAILIALIDFILGPAEE